MTSTVTDLEAVFKIWAWQQYIDTGSWFTRIDFTNASFDVKWDKVKITPSEPKYKKIKSNDTSQIVFESKYENYTDDDQTNTFRAEKETISSAVIKLTKGFSKDNKVGLELPLPSEQNLPEASKAVGCFGTRFHLASEEGISVEKKLKWSVDTTITSRKRNVTVAKLEVEETQVAYDFTMDVRLKGRIVIVIKNTKDDSIVRVIQNDVATILFDLQECSQSEDVKDARVDISKGVAVWPVVGNLTMKYGISQKVNISYIHSSGHRSGSKGRW